VKLALSIQTPPFSAMMQSCTRCLLEYNWVNSSAVKIAKSHRSCHIYDISYSKESWWPLLLFKYQLVYKAIGRHNRETLVSFGAKSNYQHQLTSSYSQVPGVYVFRKPCWMPIFFKQFFDDSLVRLFKTDICDNQSPKWNANTISVCLF
jgi:hypothetical protein